MTTIYNVLAKCLMLGSALISHRSVWSGLYNYEAIFLYQTASCSITRQRQTQGKYYQDEQYVMTTITSRVLVRFGCDQGLSHFGDETEMWEPDEPEKSVAQQQTKQRTEEECGRSKL